MRYLYVECRQCKAFIRDANISEGSPPLGSGASVPKPEQPLGRELSCGKCGFRSDSYLLRDYRERTDQDDLRDLFHGWEVERASRPTATGPTTAEAMAHLRDATRGTMLEVVLQVEGATLERYISSVLPPQGTP